MKIWTYKPGNKGIACMPLKSNVPKPNRQDWKLVKCPICGQECWESDLARQVIREGASAACTMRAITMRGYR